MPSGMELYDLTQTNDMTRLFLGVAIKRGNWHRDTDWRLLHLAHAPERRGRCRVGRSGDYRAAGGFARCLGDTQKQPRHIVGLGEIV